MGLRFRKSVTLCKGVRLNFGKTGVSVSSGIPGFRRTVHSSGRVTTSVGIPGTGIYYVDTKNPSKKKEENKSGGFFPDLFGGRKSTPTPADNNNTPYRNTQNADVTASITSPVYPNYTEQTDRTNKESSRVATPKKSSAKETPSVSEQQPIVSSANELYDRMTELQRQEKASYAQKPVSVPNAFVGKRYEEISYNTIKAIFENCDAAVDWIDVLSHLNPTSENFNADTWTYLHKKAVNVFDGDIDTYLEIINTVNPYDDLLDYAENFEFGTDDATMMEVEFSVIDDHAHRLTKSAFEDYYSAIAIRVARDTFALLPVEKVVVHAMLSNKELLWAEFDRDRFAGTDLTDKDASDTIRRVAIIR